MLIAVPSVLILSIALLWVMKAGFSDCILFIFAAVTFVLLIAFAGLALNLKSPNFDWTNEVIPIKQSSPVGITLMGGIVLSIVLAALYLPLSSAIGSSVYLLVIGVLLTAADILILRWIMTAGAEKFDKF